MELIINTLPTLIVGICLWLGIRNYNRIDLLSRRIFDKGLEEE